MDRNKKMEIIYDRDQKVENVQRISDILNQKRGVKKMNIKVKCKTAMGRAGGCSKERLPPR